MKNFSTYLLIMFTIMFWILRIMVAIITQTGGDLMGMTSWNIKYEIILIFLTLLFIVLIAKRKKIGGIAFLATYGYYFGTDLYNIITKISNQGTNLNSIINLIAAIIGIALPLFTLLDMLLEKHTRPVSNKKTDWFFENEQFDRKFDERADRNEYKF